MLKKAIFKSEGWMDKEEERMRRRRRRNPLI